MATLDGWTGYGGSRHPQSKASVDAFSLKNRKGNRVLQTAEGFFIIQSHRERMFFSIKFEAKCAEQGFSVVASETTSLTMFKARGKRGSKLLQTKTSPEPIDGQGHRQSGSSLGLPFLADVARVDGLESREGGPRSTQIAFILTPEMLQISRGLTLLTKHGFPVLTQVLHSTGRLSDDYAILQFLDLRGSFVTPQPLTSFRSVLKFCMSAPHLAASC